jgi:hypothetical protein
MISEEDVTDYKKKSALEAMSQASTVPCLHSEIQQNQKRKIRILNHTALTS